MINFFSLTTEELAENLLKNNFQKFRISQIYQWIFKNGVDNFDNMVNLPKNLREYLKSNFIITNLKLVTEQKSLDGTIKWLFATHDNKKIETVFIPEEKRGTLCISSQIGCTLNCKFCHTGTQLLEKNLDAAEIISQIFLAKKLINDFKNAKKLITNIVFMGMGEPLLNYENVKQATIMLIAKNHFDFSAKKITISTSGIIPQIDKMAEELKVGLAISFHAANDKTRTEIMPINKKYPIEQLLSCCKNYAEKTSQTITFEYVMLKDINDHDEDAKTLIKLTKELPIKFNLIPFNPWPSVKYECSSNNRIHKFSQILQDAGIYVTIRKTRGEDILAACGQLKSNF
jgi:23S rRNA (adenine2503-C2)-methyltransferase